MIYKTLQGKLKIDPVKTNNDLQNTTEIDPVKTNNDLQNTTEKTKD